jgi:hypothetical protein
VVFSEKAPNLNGFLWKWRSAEGDRVSNASFNFYFDCVTDARRHGYEPDMPANSNVFPSGLK